MVNVQRLMPSLRLRNLVGSSGGSERPRAVRVAELSDAELAPLDLSVPPWPGRKVQVGGSSLYVRTTPHTPLLSGAGASAGATAGSRSGPDSRAVDAEPALFVHGLGGSSTNWTDLTAQLSPYLESESIDLPGFGRSGPARDDDYSMTSTANLLIAYLEKSGRGSVHLFGNSMGGLISILIAIRRPDLVRTLTLVSPAVPDLRVTRVRVNPLPILLIPGIGRLAMRRVATVSPRRRAEQTIELCFGDMSRVPANRFAEAVTEVQERGSLNWSGDSFLRSFRGLVGSYLAIGPSGIWSRMADISAPTLVVWGDKDKLVDVALAPRVVTVIPDARLLVLPGVGHVSQMEAPVATARAFLQLQADSGAWAGRSSP